MNFPKGLFPDKSRTYELNFGNVTNKGLHGKEQNEFRKKMLCPVGIEPGTPDLL